MKIRGTHITHIAKRWLACGKFQIQLCSFSCRYEIECIDAINSSMVLKDIEAVKTAITTINKVKNIFFRA